MMFVILVLLCFSAVYGHSSSHKTEIHKELISCVMNVIEHYVYRRTVVFYTEEKENSILWGIITKMMEKPFMVISQSEELIDTHKLMIILFPRMNTKYTQLLKNLRKDTRYIIVGLNDFTRVDIISVLSEFHNAKMVYDILLFPNEDRINIYTSFPYSENHCAETGPPIKINTYIKGYFTKKINIFNTGKYWNMHGCTLSCLGITQPPDAILAYGENKEIVFQGITKQLLNILSEKLNFVPKITLLQNGTALLGNWFFYNDTIDLITEYVGSEQVDFAMGLFSQLAFTNDNSIIFGKETRYECYTWAVPIRAGRKRYIIMNYIDEFSFAFWVLFILCIIISVFVIVAITTILGENESLQNPVNAFHYIFATILNQPFPMKLKSWSLRLFIAHWLVYVLVVTTAYQASLWSFMTIPWQVHNIHSLQDLIDSSLEIRGAQQMLNILKAIQSNNENVKKMINKFNVLPPSDFHDIIHTIETERNLAVFGEQRHLGSYSKDINVIFDKDKVFLVDGCLMQSLATPLIFPSGSPIYEPINTMLIRLLQNGLVNKFSTLLGDQSSTQISNQINAEIPEYAVTMSVNQLRGIFVILFLGHGIAFVVLVCEIIVANMSKNQINVIFGPKLYHRK